MVMFVFVQVHVVLNLLNIILWYFEYPFETAGTAWHRYTVHAMIIMTATCCFFFGLPASYTHIHVHRIIIITYNHFASLPL